MTEEVTKNCRNCVFAVFQDEGYSNYTVEGTAFTCALKNHPQGSFDRWYGEDERLDYVCDQHVIGNPVEMDVEQEALYDLTPEQMEIYEMVNPGTRDAHLKQIEADKAYAKAKGFPYRKR